MLSLNEMITKIINDSLILSYYLSYKTNSEKNYEIVFLNENLVLRKHGCILLKKYSLCTSKEYYNLIPHNKCSKKNDLIIPLDWVKEIYLKSILGECIYSIV